MINHAKHCHPNFHKGIECIEEGIEAQCVGLKQLKRGDICEGKEHILFGLRKVEEGLCCIEKH